MDESILVVTPARWHVAGVTVGIIMKGLLRITNLWSKIVIHLFRFDKLINLYLNEIIRIIPASLVDYYL
ncbi:MAG: hypothetical protein ACXAB7_13790 [Candidatus Kariarchaeaceae archaeon]|jgi:hypothetical protein